MNKTTKKNKTKWKIKWPKSRGKKRSAALQNKGLRRFRKPKVVEKKQPSKDELWGGLSELNASFAKIKKR